MNTLNNILFAALLTSFCTSSNYTSGWFDFDELEEQIEQMHQSMRSMRKPCKHKIASSAQCATTRSITIVPHDTKVIITIPDIEGNNVEARLNETNDRLTITAPSKKIIIAVRKNILAIEAQEKIEHKKQNDTQEIVSQFTGSSFYHTQMTVGGNLELEKQTTDYNPHQKDLIITIPFKEVPQGKLVPINTIPSPTLLKTTPVDTPIKDAPIEK